MIKRTETEGFGMRNCIWVQGCSIYCPYCKNRHICPFENGKELTTKEVILGIKVQKEIEEIALLDKEF